MQFSTDHATHTACSCFTSELERLTRDHTEILDALTYHQAQAKQFKTRADELRDLAEAVGNVSIAQTGVIDALVAKVECLTAHAAAIMADRDFVMGQLAETRDTLTRENRAKAEAIKAATAADRELAELRERFAKLVPCDLSPAGSGWCHAHMRYCAEPAPEPAHTATITEAKEAATESATNRVQCAYVAPNGTGCWRTVFQPGAILCSMHLPDGSPDLPARCWFFDTDGDRCPNGPTGGFFCATHGDTAEQTCETGCDRPAMNGSTLCLTCHLERMPGYCQNCGVGLAEGVTSGNCTRCAAAAMPEPDSARLSLASNRCEFDDGARCTNLPEPGTYRCADHTFPQPNGAITDAAAGRCASCASPKMADQPWCHDCYLRATESEFRHVPGSNGYANPLPNLAKRHTDRDVCLTCGRVFRPGHVCTDADRIDHEGAKAVAAEIRRALKARGLDWVSVTNDRGTAYGWLRIAAQKSKGADEWGRMTEAQWAQLVRALDLPYDVRRVQQSINVPSGGDYHVEYIDRANGRKPTWTGEQYWD